MNASPSIATCWHLTQWPASDQVVWARDILPGDPFDDPHYGSTLALDSLKKTRKGYGRWLSFLASRSWLDSEVPALERVTRPRLRAYFRTLQKAGNASSTISGRFTDLTMALRILAPGNDVSWVCKPDGVTVHALLRKTQRTLVVPHSDVLFHWGLDMMDAAAAQPLKSAHLTAYRDGLLIALFAARGRRLRSMSLLRIGRELLRPDQVFRIELTPDQVKTKKHDRFDLPAKLTSYIAHYLEVVRPILVKHGSSDDVWIGRGGRKLPAKSIQERIFTLSLKRFGTAFGPHRFRHAIGTTAPLLDPAHPGVAAGMLGISKKVLELHYNRSGQVQATTTFAEITEKRRQALRNRSLWVPR